MILVVADTSPLNYLVQIGCAHLLPELYDRVMVPDAVFEELTDLLIDERKCVRFAQHQGLEISTPPCSVCNRAIFGIHRNC